MQSLCTMRHTAREPLIARGSLLASQDNLQAKKRLILPRCLDIRPEGVEPVGEIFVTSVDVVYIAQNGAPRGCEHREHHDDTGAQGWWCNDIGRLPAGGATDVNAVWIDHLYLCAKASEVGEVNGAVIVAPVVHQSAARCYRGDEAKEGEIIHVDAREGHTVELVLWSGESRFVQANIDQASLAITRWVLAGELIL